MDADDLLIAAGADRDADAGVGPGSWTPRAVFGPARGVTTAGVVACGLLTAVLWGGALLVADAPIAARIFVIAVSCLPIAVAYGIARASHWRLLVCEEGVVQMGAGSVAAMPWGEIDDLVLVAYRGFVSPFKATIVGGGRSIRVQPINCRRRDELFRVLVENASARHVAVRTEWLHGD